jgi:shikimate kinase
LNNLIFIGFKRSGKTSTGKKVALKLDKQFIDTDDLIALDCRQFSQEIGIDSFRLLEKKIIFSLSIVQNAVIATGGGSILDPDNVSQLKKLGKLIYLHVPKDKLKERLLKPPLPSFLDPKDLDGSFEKMYAHRAPIYEKIADIIVKDEKTLWEVIPSELCSASPRGESLTAKR